MKNTIFISFLLFILSVNLASSQNNTGIDAPAYENSKTAYEKGKKEHGNSYQFTIKFASFSGYWTKTTFIVKNGKVTERHFESRKEGSKELSKNWKEKGSKLGSHNRGNAITDMDKIYEEAKGWLSGTSENKYFFEVDKLGILATAGFLPDNCLDDCFEGYHIEDFKWLE